MRELRTERVTYVSDGDTQDCLTREGLYEDGEFMVMGEGQKYSNAKSRANISQTEILGHTFVFSPCERALPVC